MNQYENSRKVIERIFIHGELKLETPAHFGNGDAEGLTDIPLLYDALDGETPLLTGASIAGALRNYLREYERGYGWAEEKFASTKSRAERLFGHLDHVNPEQKATLHSWLMVDDALGKPLEKEKAVELRDGVTIDPRTRTVEEHNGRGQKYDIELLAAGTTFPLAFEFWRTKENSDLLEALVIALQGFEKGRIGLGLRKRRGFGECRVSAWKVWRYSMQTVDGLIGWLKHNPNSGELKSNIATLLGVSPRLDDQRKEFVLDGLFELDGSLLIRSDTRVGDASDSSDSAGDAPDMVHLHSWRNGMETPILSGTSVAGVIRNRALRIANTMLGRELGTKLVNEMFGERIRSHKDKPSGSRVTIKEKTVTREAQNNFVQNRVKIDRFTGGSYPQALFSQQPVWGPARIEIGLILREFQKTSKADFNAQVGLLLLVLKDLWTGDLPLGGESSVGRGRLRGVSANLAYAGQNWKIERNASGKLKITGMGELDEFVRAFRGWGKTMQERRKPA